MTDMKTIDEKIRAEAEEQCKLHVKKAFAALENSLRFSQYSKQVLCNTTVVLKTTSSTVHKPEEALIFTRTAKDGLIRAAIKELTPLWEDRAVDAFLNRVEEIAADLEELQDIIQP